MATARYRHLRKRVNASNAPYHSSIATKNKEVDIEKELKKLESWNELSNKSK